MSKFIDPAAKLLRHPDRLNAWRRGEFVAPVGMEMDISNRCNEGCAECHFGYTHARGPLAKRHRGDMLEMGDLMDRRLAHSILYQLARAGVKSVTFSGGGEPTLHPEFEAIVQIALDAGLQVGLYTNATLLPPERAQFIKANFEWVVVSLDEATAERYFQYKQVDLFPRACEGIRRLATSRGKATIGVSFLLSEENAADLAAMIALHRKLGSDYAEFRPLVLFALDEPAVAKTAPTWIDTLLPELETLSREPDLEIPLEKFVRYRHFQRGYHVCGAVLFTGVITPNGKVWTCVNRRGFADSLVGDLNAEPFRTLWARQGEWTDFAKCRILCRGDALNVQLERLRAPLPHENFI